MINIIELDTTVRQIRCQEFCISAVHLWMLLSSDKVVTFSGPADIRAIERKNSPNNCRYPVMDLFSPSGSKGDHGCFRYNILVAWRHIPLAVTVTQVARDPRRSCSTGHSAGVGWERNVGETNS